MKTVGVVGGIALLVGSAAADVHDFPSAGSTVVGSIGFIDDDEVGFFWSVSRGDSVAETVADSNPTVDRAILDVEVVQNVLNSGAFLNWDLSINGTVVGNFTVNEGDLGPINLDVSFPAIPANAGTYDVMIAATNEVAGGQGSHTLAYSDVNFNFANSIELLPAPGSLALLGLGGLAAARRRR